MIKHKFTWSFSSSSDLKEAISLIHAQHPASLHLTHPIVTKWLVVNHTKYIINNITQYNHLTEAPNVLNFCHNKSK